MYTFDPVELTRFLLRHDTTTGHINPSFLDDFTTQLSQCGFNVRSVDVEGVRHLAATIGPHEADVRIAFVGHYDTVPVGEGWTRPAHAAHQEGEVLFGRGASDMKSGDAAAISAAARLASKGVHSTVFLPGDEETFSRGMPALISALNLKFDYCICAEPTSRDRLGDCVKFGRRGAMRGIITLKGQQGHAAYAHRTPNVILRLPEVIMQLAKPWNDHCHGTDTTLSITNITTNSTASNVIPGAVYLSFNLRFAPHRTPAEIEHEIQERLKASTVPYELVVDKVTLPYMTDVDADPVTPQGRLIASIKQAVHELLSIEPVLSCDGGTSDARFIAAQGVPTIEFGVPHGNMHGPDEFVSVRDIERLTQVYERVVELLRQ
jgi:succinyl-diaminopimelate desuccinylase